MASHDSSSLLEHPLWGALHQLVTQEPREYSLLLLTYQDLPQRGDLLNQLIPQAEQFQHIWLELGNAQVQSLSETLQRRLEDLIAASPEESVYYLINRGNLEATLLQELQQGVQSALLPKINEEAEVIHQGFPFAMICWADGYLTDRLEREAPNFWQQLTHHLDFRPPDTQESGDDYLSFMEAVKDANEDESAEAQLLMAEAFRKRSALKSAEELYQAILSREGVEAEVKAKTFWGMSYLLQVQEQTLPAMEALKNALSAAEEATLQTEILMSLAELQQGAGLRDEAIQNLGRALEIGAETSPALERVTILRQLARLLERKGKLDSAINHYEMAIETWEEMEGGHPVLLAQTWQQIGAIRQNQQRYPEALSAFEAALEVAEGQEDEFLVHALEDSVESMQALVKPKPTTASSEPAKKKKKGFFGLFGGKG
ncbi:MAG: tetratricopeptide repeat protein [Bacteroidota bacterium]